MNWSSFSGRLTLRVGMGTPQLEYRTFGQLCQAPAVRPTARYSLAWDLWSPRSPNARDLGHPAPGYSLVMGCSQRADSQTPNGPTQFRMGPQDIPVIR